MKALFSGIAVAALVAAIQPAASQTNPPQIGAQTQSSQDNSPGAGGTSKPDTPGAPGSKSGTTVTPHSGKNATARSNESGGGDESGVRGKPGSESGTTVNPPASEKATGSRTQTSGTNSSGQNEPTSTEGIFTSVSAKDDLSSKVVGLDVYNNANQDIGTIKDIAFNATGVKAYIVGVGGFLSMGEHYVAVRPSAIKLSYNASEKKWHAAMDTNVDQLKGAPEYKYAGGY